MKYQVCHVVVVGCPRGRDVNLDVFFSMNRVYNLVIYQLDRLDRSIGRFERGNLDQSILIIKQALKN